ncbi:SBP domain-containing protein, partial [Haematococcus lacustris]
VAGCGRDLRGLKDYHQRYGICELHIKLPQVLKEGRLQRFCQQCGRFHDLAAFDVGRKSCREQLHKHNERRRRRTQVEAKKTRASGCQAGRGVGGQGQGVKCENRGCV